MTTVAQKERKPRLRKLFERGSIRGVPCPLTSHTSPRAETRSSVSRKESTA